MANKGLGFVSSVLLMAASFISAQLSAQTLTTGNRIIDNAFKIAISTIDKNITPEGLILAGGAYGGEWTRDCAINSLNALSLIRTDAAEYSLWSVTNDRRSVGHQYWDKIIWVIAAWDHYMVTGDNDFLRQAYQCARTTFAELEMQHFNERYGLFMGPAVFQDGIAGYDEPVYQKGNPSTYVLDHDADHIMCLSTNCIYYKAYQSIASMAWQLKLVGSAYDAKAKNLKKAIRRHFYNKTGNQLYYYIDQNGKTHNYTEALGVAFAALYEVVSEKEAQKIIRNVHSTRYGVPVVYPAFPRFSESKPGRHNVMIWPHVNMFFASACAYVGEFDRRSQQPCQSCQEQRRFLRNLRPSHRQTKRRISVRQTLGRMSRPDLVRHRICATILIRHIRHTTYPIGTAFPTIRHAQRKGMFASRTTFPQQHYQHHRARSRQGRLA